MISLAGKAALITGGSRGIGLAIATRLANEGVSCLLVARNADTLKAACSQLPQKTTGTRPHGFFAGEAGDTAIWDSIGRQLAADKNEVDILVNAAGVSQNSLLARTTASDISTILDTNLRAAVLASKVVGKQMMRRDAAARRGCSIINVSSVMASRGGTGASVYAASKAGLLGLTSALSQELGQFQIRVNALVPGYIQTQMIENLNEEKLSSQIPLGRVGRAEEVADAAFFLATNSYANNCILNIDGGLSAANQGFVSRGSS
ncbi:3-oxoacyl-acyl carrier protein reductase [Diaporthe amygdali]|uniref:3-oxoacyl-acyl carrier protein reductase n=1 Tax=Phomopsis amygdali TaxID=1214568 RepID=UPI0022FDD8FD|nr:3-oxoacyl-acyl carrier protein reductase [Diaporthe amygdali]KAJ0125228.1 3-oxoacyl-acyl carrier protein reductase [Diaporthe amygdali]